MLFQGIGDGKKVDFFTTRNGPKIDVQKVVILAFRFLLTHLIEMNYIPINQIKLVR